ncbi:hypothetical protein BC629DRAFT_1738721 [Irpex lacteus]|nr:hypothetical protein BC629DRAFT_1738721 [Irpex lacteus]
MSESIDDFNDNKSPPIQVVVYTGSVEGYSEGVDVTQTITEPAYRRPKHRRRVLICLVGPIANDTAHEFGLLSDRSIGWHVLTLTVIPASIAAVLVRKRLGCAYGSTLLVVSGWVRYAGTAKSLSASGSLGLLMLGQILAGSAQPMFQVIGPSFSETWFGLKSRTTATMILSVAHPLGSAIAQIISPRAGTVQTSILVLAIICTCTVPVALLMSEAPPTPPTHAATHERPSPMSLIRALAGRELKDKRSYMTVRERTDFFLLIALFGVLVGVVTSSSLLTAERFNRMATRAGFWVIWCHTPHRRARHGWCHSSPFDRVLTNHLALTLKVACPSLGVLWLSMIWAVKPNNSGALFAINALIGGLSLPILPAALELAVEVTRNADGSTACLWSAGSLMTVILVLIENALRAGPNASPPFNMHRAFVLQGALTLAVTSLVFGLRETDTTKVG